MAISVVQQGVVIQLTVLASDGSQLHFETYNIAEAAIVPEIPTVGAPWDVVVGGTSWPTVVVGRKVTTFFAGSTLTTQISVETERS